MSKIICDVCGTSYPDTANQCPICGCVRSADAQGVMTDELDSQGGYTYVKGGRFSKSNVKKRNKATPKPAPKDNYDQEPREEDEQEEKSNTGLLIIAILLLLAIVAVVIYIALHFFGPAASKPTAAPPVNTGNVSVQSTSRPVVTDPVEVPCNSVSLDVAAISFKIKNAVRMLNVSVQPANTTDEIIFISSDPAVVTVNNDGKVLAVGRGEAVITVICGNATFSCNVECTFEDPSTETTVPPESETTPPAPTETTPPQQTTFTLNRKDITFQRKGESWTIYSGNLGLSLITWTSDNEDIATIKNGKVTAVGSGTTTVYGEYNGEKVGCIIRCSFDDENENPGVGGNGGVTEDGGSSDTTGEGYSLKNMVGGRNDDVTITVGYSFSLQLIDGQGNPVSNVAWSSSNDSVCTVVDGKVTGVGSGLATVTASYEGKTYKCIIHVN